jgi:hypothetical protein
VLVPSTSSSSSPLAAASRRFRSISEPTFEATSKPGTSIGLSVSKLLDWSRPFASAALVKGAQIGLEGVLSFFFGSAFTPTLVTDSFLLYSAVRCTNSGCSFSNLSLEATTHTSSSSQNSPTQIAVSFRRRLEGGWVSGFRVIFQATPDTRFLQHCRLKALRFCRHAEGGRGRLHRRRRRSPSR